MEDVATANTQEVRDDVGHPGESEKHLFFRQDAGEGDFEGEEPGDVEDKYRGL